MSPSTTRRWSPTPEQLMILKELYRSGVRTPNATQIQKITNHLAFYGKIQCKNVFYWFQNHKARDRQKMRKKLAKQLHQQHLLYTSFQHGQQKDFHLHPYNLHYFQYAPIPPFHYDQLTSTSSTYSSERLHPQATGSCETWRLDFPRDRIIPGTSLEEGPTSFSENRPLKALELFPLKSERTV